MQLWLIIVSNKTVLTTNCICSKGKRSPRCEVLINIDPLSRGGEPLYNDTFDSSIRGAIRLGPWKLITGVPDVTVTLSDGTFEQTSEANLDLVRYIFRNLSVGDQNLCHDTI